MTTPTEPAQPETDGRLDVPIEPDPNRATRIDELMYALNLLIVTLHETPGMPIPTDVSCYHHASGDDRDRLAYVRRAALILDVPVKEFPASDGAKLHSQVTMDITTGKTGPKIEYVVVTQVSAAAQLTAGA